MREQGFIKEPGDDATEVGEPLTHERIEGVKTDIDDAYDIENKYKSFNVNVKRATYDVLRFIEGVKDYDTVPSDYDGISKPRVICNDSLSAALNRRLTKKLELLSTNVFETDVNSEAYAKLAEDAKNIDLHDAMENLQITGSFENLPFAFSEAELKVFLLTSVPALALASVKRIQFRPMTKEEDKEDTTLGFHRWSKELDGSEIIISDSKIRENYERKLKLWDDDPKAEQYALRSAKDSMLGTITHEFAHELHEMLPFAALKRWEDQRATDSTNVTAYAKSRHDSDHPHRYMEDFSDTMELFINRPDVLIVISPTRFNAMKEIFEDFMQNYADITSKRQKLQIDVYKMVRSIDGTSDEDLKSIYLSHETPE